jgi:hypothetical protein
MFVAGLLNKRRIRDEMREFGPLRTVSFMGRNEPNVRSNPRLVVCITTFVIRLSRTYHSLSLRNGSLRTCLEYGVFTV